MSLKTNYTKFYGRKGPKLSGKALFFLVGEVILDRVPSGLGNLAR